MNFHVYFLFLCRLFSFWVKFLRLIFWKTKFLAFMTSIFNYINLNNLYLLIPFNDMLYIQFVLMTCYIYVCGVEKHIDYMHKTIKV